RTSPHPRPVDCRASLFDGTTPTEISTLSLHDALPISGCYGSTDLQTPNFDRLAAEGCRFTQWYGAAPVCSASRAGLLTGRFPWRSEEHTSELQSRENLVCRLLLEKKKLILTDRYNVRL